MSTKLHNLEAEQGLLGIILLNNEGLNHALRVGLEPSHFSEPIHQIIYAELRRQISAGHRVTPVTLKSALPALDIPTPSGSTISLFAYLVLLTERATAFVNAGDYATLTRNLALTRQLLDISDRLGGAHESAIGPDEALKLAFDEIDGVRLSLAEAHRAPAVDLGDAVDDVVEYMTGVLQGTIIPGGVMTGIHQLDTMLGGFKGGELVIVAGRPGSGKSTVAGSLARQLSRPTLDPKTGEITSHGIGLFSLEMPQRHMGARLLADQAFNADDPIFYKSIMEGKLDYHNAAYPQSNEGTRLERLGEAARALRDYSLTIDPSASLSIGELTARTAVMERLLLRKFKTKLKVLVIDYLAFVKAGERYKGNRVYEVGEITAGLKMLARNMDVCVILLAQLNRKVEERANKRPELQDLRESGSLEQDADVVMFLYREAYYLATDPKLKTDGALQIQLAQCQNTMELIIAKQRMGPTGICPVYCDIGCGTIRNATTQTTGKQLAVRHEDPPF